MIEQLLEARLRPVWQRRWWLDLGWRLAGCWAGAAVISAAVLLLSRALRLSSPLTLLLLALATLFATAFVIVRQRRRRPDLLRIARELESRDAQLDGRLTTALEQRPSTEGSLSFLQHRLIVEAVETSFRQNWPQEISWARLAGAGATSAAALILWLVILATLYVPRPAGATGLVVRVADLEVTPGHVEVERGNSLVVLARFGGSVPADARMIVTPRTGTPQTIPLTRSLGDPVFGGTLPEVTDDFTYRVEAGSRKSEEFKVKVFEFPRLQRADADLEYPPYTRLANKRIEDTRRVSAVEGTTLDLGLQLNKPVVSARLKPRGTTNGVLELSESASQASVTLTNFVLVQGGTYDLELIDSDGRTNKAPAQFVFDVVVNRTPELKFIQPRGDQRPSALEELTFEGSVWDDFGVLAYGFAYANGPGEAVVVTLGTNAPAQERRTFRHALSLEDLGVAPDDLISWYLWADDLGPDGQIRRTQSDLFFGEVRPFDEIFRENQSGGGGGGGQQGNQDGSPTSKLAELQKKILNATWKLERERLRATPAAHTKDVEVVRDSQSDALDQAKEQSSGAADPRAEVMWGSVLTSMEKALTQLVAATNKTASLQASLAAETGAYQALLKLREREFQVSRNQRQQGGGGGGGEQQRQRQLSELDLTDEANRYETQREAQTPQSAERQEQLQVLSRLSELARRQEDLNERLKELQAQLQEADTEKEREEIRRQLKRLQEEQQEMLADADELQQRLDRPENQSRFAEQRKQLEQTRDELQKASEAAAQGATSQALASGTRAQEQLQQMREQVQQESSSQFAEDLRQMRQEARELTRQQEQVRQELDALQNEQKRSLSNSSAREALVKQLESQQSRLTNLLADVTQVSQAAEASEPIVSRQLYDTLRQMNQADAGLVKQLQEDLINQGQMTRSLYDRLEESQEAGEGRALSVLQDLVQEGLLPQAEAVDEKARKTLAQLQRGVEKAAESVLGDDTQALQRAQQELAELTSQLERELAQAGGPGSRPGAAPGGQPGSTNAPAGGASAGPADPQAPGSPGAPQTAQTSPTPGSPGSPSDGAPGQTPGQTPGQSPGQGPGQTPGRGQGGQPGQGQQPGSGGSPSDTAQAPQAGRAPGQSGQRGQSGQAGGLGTGPGEFDLSALESLGGNNTGGGGGGRGGSGVLTSEEYGPWTDRLREVEDMIDDPGLRSQVANARERARLARQEVRRDLKKPDWAVVRLQVLQPLVEVQQQIREELRRRDPGESLVPIDRDPVPSRYAELVRRYYEQLGKE